MIRTHMDHLRMSSAVVNHTMDGDWHIDHCFEYLQRTLVCCGDTALEGQGKTSEPGADGTGAVHLCKDYDGLVEWAEDHRISDSVII